MNLHNFATQNKRKELNEIFSDLNLGDQVRAIGAIQRDKEVLALMELEGEGEENCVIKTGMHYCLRAYGRDHTKGRNGNCLHNERCVTAMTPNEDRAFQEWRRNNTR